MADTDPTVARLLEECHDWTEEPPPKGIMRAAGPVPHLGSLVDLVDEARAEEFLRFWVCEVLTSDLLERFRDEAVYPDRLPPSLKFIKAAMARHLERYEEDRSWLPYLFCLNTLVMYALGWRPDRPNDSMLKLAAGDSSVSDEPWARGGGQELAKEAREHLLTVVFADKVSWVAHQAHRNFAENLLAIEVDDVEQQARVLASKLIAGESIDEMAAMIVGDRIDDQTEEMRPLQMQAIRQLSKEFQERDPGANRYERLRVAEHVIVGHLFCLDDLRPLLDHPDVEEAVKARIQEELSGDPVNKLKSFWPNPSVTANLTTHLFGSTRGGPGRLYSELSEWLERERKKALLGPVSRGAGPPLREGDFQEIDWEELLGKQMATPLNLAILHGTMVEGLEGQALRAYLQERGFEVPKQDAIRQRVRHMKKKIADHYGDRR